MCIFCFCLAHFQLFEKLLLNLSFWLYWGPLYNPASHLVRSYGFWEEVAQLDVVCVLWVSLINCIKAFFSAFWKSLECHDHFQQLLGCFIYLVLPYTHLEVLVPPDIDAKAWWTEVLWPVLVIFHKDVFSLSGCLYQLSISIASTSRVKEMPCSCQRRRTWNISVKP